MNSNQLYHFKTIAECGNITKAAEVLYITQPALSTSLRKLGGRGCKTAVHTRGPESQINREWQGSAKLCPDRHRCH